LTSVSSWSSLARDGDIGGASSEPKASLQPVAESKIGQSPEVALLWSQLNAEELAQTDYCADEVKVLSQIKSDAFAFSFSPDQSEGKLCEHIDVQGDDSVPAPAPSPSAIPESKFAFCVGRSFSQATDDSEQTNSPPECDSNGKRFMFDSVYDGSEASTDFTISSNQQMSQPASEPPSSARLDEYLQLQQRMVPVSVEVIPKQEVPQVQIIHQKPQSRSGERVAELEGALEMSRDRVRHLENELRKKGTEMNAPRAELEGALAISRERVLHLEAELSKKGADEAKLQKRIQELDSLRSETEQDLDVLNRVMALENSLQVRADELEGFRQMADGKVLNLEALEQYENRFADLQQEIQSREERIIEASKVHDRRARDLAHLSEILQAREDANVEYQERLCHWEKRLSLVEQMNSPRSVCSDRQRSPSGTPKARRNSGAVKTPTPARNPRSLPRPRTPPRTPQQSRRATSPVKPPALRHSTPSFEKKAAPPAIVTSPSSRTGTPKRMSSPRRQNFPPPASSRGNTPTRWRYTGASGRTVVDGPHWTTTYQTAFSP